MFLVRPHKTAGTALARALMASYAPRDVCPHGFAYELANADSEKASPYRFYWPHAGLPTVDRVTPDAVVLTILRDPFRRLISSFFFWKAQVERFPDGSHHAVAKTLQSMTLLDYVQSTDPAIRRATDNVQARLLAGAEFGPSPSQRTQLFDTPVPDDEVVDRALANLGDRFTYVAVAEDMHQSMADIHRLLDLGRPPSVAVVNPTPRRWITEQVTPEIREAAEPLLRMDNAVYAYRRGIPGVHHRRPASAPVIQASSVQTGN